MTGVEAVRALRDGLVLASLDGRGAVSFRGPDARRFCNGMFTNNVRDLPVGEAHRSALLDDRGRVQGLLRLGCAAVDTFVAFPDGGDEAGFEDRFSPFLVFDDVEVSPLGLGAGFHVAGPEAAAVLHGLGLPAPSGLASHPEGWVMAADRFGIAGWDVWGVAAPGRPIGEDVAALLRVLAGRVVWPTDVGEKRLVHELGLREDVLHFVKGCYIGQETVNRVDVMGGVKRRLAGITFLDGGAILSGAAVEVDGETVGHLGSIGRLDGAAWALAVLKMPFDAAGTLVSVSATRGVTAGFPMRTTA